MSGEWLLTMISGYLTAFTVKGKIMDKIVASTTKMRAHGLGLLGDHSDALEILGIVGDRCGSFNMSIITFSFVVAARGLSVIKHGNRAANSRCGAANVPKTLGANINMPPETI